MLLATQRQLDERRAAAAGPLAPLADSLAHDLEPLVGRDLFVPPEKAELSRAGGRCERDGAMLEFDPFAPRSHRCATCGAEYDGDAHYRWWIYWYQLWLAERAVHAALLHSVRGDERHAVLARDILNRYCETYATYPNRDNVLGPTRVFFSTYLESIWLLQLCVATDLLADSAATERVRERIIEPSAALIAQYDEGMSNRQVWNNAALMAAALMLGDKSRAERIAHGDSGVETHLRHGLLRDGTWYEGENYHLFAHRGLWYGVTMAERAALGLAPDLLARFDEGFATPFATALPDFTLPSRKDSQYAISLRQWRFAESCELGLARRDDARVRGALARLYANDIPRADTGRARSSAEAERNAPPSQLSRADLGWRSLLRARAELPPLDSVASRSAHLPGQGISVFRRDAGDVYVALDWGQFGGGHGHPDRLNVTFAHGGTRWLDDLGTGSYVDKSLHWYRSTLAHNAPMVNGRSQFRVDGRLLAYDERGGVGWILAEADGVAPNTSVQRAVIVTPDYFVDEVRWTSGGAARFELPIHFDGDAAGLTFSAATLDGGDGDEDGFGFVRGAESAAVSAGATIELGAAADGRTARAFVNASAPARVFRATAPAQPAIIRKRFYVVRCDGESGVVRSVWAWGTRVSDVKFAADAIEVTLGNERHVHRQTPEYWQIEMTAGAAHSGIELFGWQTAERETPEDATTGRREDGRPSRAPLTLPRGGGVLLWELGASHYRRSEQTWEEAGRPTARVTATAEDDELVIRINAAVGDPVLVPADAVNAYDNEHPDINGHGVQLYVRTESSGGAWVLVPEAQGARIRRLPEWGRMKLHRAEWRTTADGFDAAVRVPLAPGEHIVALDIIINETTPGRARRRGQLVMSGAHGEFVYLRGDRHDPGRLVLLAVAD